MYEWASGLNRAQGEKVTEFPPAAPPRGDQSSIVNGKASTQATPNIRSKATRT